MTFEHKMAENSISEYYKLCVIKVTGYKNVQNSRKDRQPKKFQKAIFSGAPLGWAVKNGDLDCLNIFNN